MAVNDVGKIVILAGQSNMEWLSKGTQGVKDGTYFRSGITYLETVPPTAGAIYTTTTGWVASERLMYFGSLVYDYLQTGVAVCNIAIGGASLLWQNSIGLGYWTGPGNLIDLGFSGILTGLTGLFKTHNVDVIWHQGSIDATRNISSITYAQAFFSMLANMRDRIGLPDSNTVRIGFAPPGKVMSPAMNDQAMDKVRDTYEGYLYDMEVAISGYDSRPVATHHDYEHGNTDIWHMGESGFTGFAGRLAHGMYGPDNIYWDYIDLPSYVTGVEGSHSIDAHFKTGIALGTGNSGRMFDIQIHTAQGIELVQGTGIEALSTQILRVWFNNPRNPIQTNTVTLRYARGSGYGRSWPSDSLTLLYQPSGVFSGERQAILPHRKTVGLGIGGSVQPAIPLP